MLLPRLARLLGIVSRQGVRNASYINPKFAGGPAKPHELGKNMRQKLFEKAELWFFIPAFLVISGIWLLKPSSENYKNYLQERFDVTRTLYYYPYPERDDSEE